VLDTVPLISNNETAAAARVTKKKETDAGKDACYGEIRSTTTTATDTGSMD
jgi:hypothetical protein